MIDEKPILGALRKFDDLYQSALGSSDPKDATYYAKLAVLECCGWIEETMDDIVMGAVSGKIKTRKFKQILSDKIIKPNHGFQYRGHFRPMLMQAIGLVDVEKVEMALDKEGDLDTLKTNLESMEQYRNHAAHTSVVGTTKTYPAPSKITDNLIKLYPIFQKIWHRLNSDDATGQKADDR